MAQSMACSDSPQLQNQCLGLSRASGHALNYTKSQGTEFPCVTHTA